jgi:hypothetical protein
MDICEQQIKSFDVKMYYEVTTELYNLIFLLANNCEAQNMANSGLCWCQNDSAGLWPKCLPLTDRIRNFWQSRHSPGVFSHIFKDCFIFYMFQKYFVKELCLFLLSCLFYNLESHSTLVLVPFLDVQRHNSIADIRFFKIFPNAGASQWFVVHEWSSRKSNKSGGP